MIATATVPARIYTREERARRLEEARAYFAKGKEADRLFRAGVRDESGATVRKVEGRFAHEWFSLAWVTADRWGWTREDVRAEG